FGVAVLALWCALVGVFALSVMGERARLEAAADAVEAGLSAARAGDADHAGVLLQRAAVELTEVDDVLDRWWTRPARTVPIVGHQIAAARTLVAAATDIATTAADAARATDSEALVPHDHRVDIAAITSLAPRL